MDSLSETELASISEPAVVHSATSIEATNSRFETIVDESTEDCAGQSLTAFVAPPFRDTVEEACRRVADGEAEHLAVEMALQPAQSADATHLAVNTPVTWQGSRAVQTRFVRRPPLGAASSSLSHAVVEQAPSGITVLDASENDTPILYANDAFCDLTGYPKEAVLGRPFRVLTGEATDDAKVDELESALGGETATSIELQCHTRTGSVFWNELTLSPVETDDGAGDYWVAYHSDVSERKAAEKQRRIFETYAEASDDVMVVTDSNGVIEDVNDAFQEVTGYAPEEAIGKTPRILKSGEHDAEFYEELWNAVLDGETWESVILNRTKGGHIYETTQKVVPIEDDSGEIQQFVAIEREITQKQLRQQILDVLNRILRHNVRNCVTVVDAHAQMLATDPEASKVESMATSIQERTSTLTRIAERTETIRKLIHSFENDEQPTPIEFAHAKSVIDEYSASYEDADIDVAVTGDDDAAIRYGYMFEVVIEELLDNAVRHNDQPTPEVEVTVAETEATDTALIEVADNGPGIPTTTWDVIESGEETPLEHTDGIGLWVVYWAVTALGGTVDYEANEPRGSVIQLRVPLERT
jgi:PAS domain S-box-containing protein